MLFVLSFYFVFSVVWFWFVSFVFVFIVDWK